MSDNTANIAQYIDDANENIATACSKTMPVPGQAVLVQAALAQAQLATALVLADLLEEVKRHGRTTARTK